MENASKALLMAGGVFIAILLLTLFSYLFTQMGQSTGKIYDNMEKHKIAEFNQQFLNYEGRNLTAQEVATLINMAINSNSNKKFLTTIEVLVDSTNFATSAYKNEEWLNDELTSNKTYKCTKVNINSETLLVDKVIIQTSTNP